MALPFELGMILGVPREYQYQSVVVYLPMVWQREQGKCMVNLSRREIQSSFGYCFNVGVLLPTDYLLG